MDAMSSLCARSRPGVRLLSMGLSCVLMVALCCAPAFATAPTLPSTGVDVGEWVTAVITAFGAVVAVIVGGYFAFLLIKKGLQWSRRAFG